MATFSLLTFLTLSLLIATSSARPCKTLFYFSTTTTTTSSLNPNYPTNPYFIFPTNAFSKIHKPRYFTLVLINPNPTTLDHEPQSSDNGYSIKDRTMDIMSVVGALLFGVGCGALTASIMYFLWAIFSSSRDVDFDVVAVSDEEDGDDFDDEEAAAKKKGFEYVKVADGEKNEEKTNDVV